jgi:hypothetical protein
MAGVRGRVSTNDLVIARERSGNHQSSIKTWFIENNAKKTLYFTPPNFSDRSHYSGHTADQSNKFRAKNK